MSNLNEKDIARWEDKNMENVRKEYQDIHIRPVTDDLYEWSCLITELTGKEKALLEWEELYQFHSDKIIAETDFKALFGKNNADVRKQYVKEELSDWYATILDLEARINWINRRISYLKELIRTKRTLMEVKE